MLQALSSSLSQLPPSPGTTATPQAQQQLQGALSVEGGAQGKPLTLGDLAEAASSKAGSSPSSAGMSLAAAVAEVGSTEAAILCIEAAVYDLLEALYQQAQLARGFPEPTASQKEGAQDQKQSLEGSSSSSKEQSESSEARDAEAEAEAQALLEVCCQVLHAVSRGSELHVFKVGGCA